MREEFKDTIFVKKILWPKFSKNDKTNPIFPLKGVRLLNRFLPEVDSCSEKLIKAYDLVSEDQLVPSTDWCKLDLIKEKESFDVHAVRWLSHNEPLEEQSL